jgi:signal transduction histidine kinase
MRLDFSPEPVDLSAIAEGIVEELRREHPQHRVEALIRPGLTAVGDRSMLAIALRNLLDNAWKYTGRTPAPRVELDACAEGGRMLFFVRDNGVGFDMAYADRLFSPFQRLHSSEEFPGTGVGLATVARIIHRHHGTIRAESSPGCGARFLFTIGASAPA